MIGHVKEAQGGLGPNGCLSPGRRSDSVARPNRHLAAFSNGFCLHFRRSRAQLGPLDSLVVRDGHRHHRGIW